ncbi:MAG: ABC transporter substrate-binding protein [Mesorhizobium sp.]
MGYELTRRGFLAGAATAGVTVLGMPWSNVVHAADGRIVVRVEEDLKNLDPANRTGTIEVNVILAVNQGLVKFKPGSTEWENDAAEEIRQVSDTLIEFKLKEGLKFTGGYGDLTAEDVKFSFERFKPAPDGTKVDYGDDWAALDSVEVTGPLTGKIHLKNASPAVWLIALADGSGAIISKKAFEALGDKFKTTPIGSGPYMLKEWVPRDHFTLVANPDYLGEKPAFTEIVGKPISDDKTAQIAVQAGEIDFGRIDPAVATDIASTSGIKVEKISAIDYVWIGPNIEKKPFDDVRVRQAIRLALDVPAIIAAAYNGSVEPAYALEAPGILGFWEDAPKYARDIEAAKKLLDEAGQGGGFSTRLTVLNKAVAQATAAVVQANLAEVGIDVQIDALDPGAYWAYGENDASKDLELVLVEYHGKFDPGFQTQWFTSDQIGTWNWQRWSNKDFDDLHKKGGVESDPKKREQIYIDAQKLMDESAAFWWITHNAYTYAFKDTLQPGILPNGSQMQYAAFKQA